MDRYAEFEKYERAYKQPSYRMGNKRKNSAKKALKAIKTRGSYLDVGCGRGEMVEFAKELGFSTSVGVEVVDCLLNENVVYGQAHNLPFNDNEFDVVTSFDAFEHFLPEDTAQALSEINRVARKVVILCIAFTPSNNGRDELHINLRPVKEWAELIGRYIDGEAELIPETYRSHSKTWVITKE